MNVYINLYSYEYVHLNQSDMKKFGFIGAGINLVSKGVNRVGASKLELDEIYMSRRSFLR